MLGIEPLHGRTFPPADDEHDAPAVLVLGHGYWTTRFGGDPAIVGQSFEMNGRPKGALVATQVALSMVLLAAAGVLLASCVRLQQIASGYPLDGVVTAEVFGNFRRYPDAPSLLRFYLPVLDRLESEPAIVTAALGASRRHVLGYGARGSAMADRSSISLSDPGRGPPWTGRVLI